MKNKKWLLLLIIAFPSVFWLLLESSTINSRKLPHYGPGAVDNKGDSTFYRISEDAEHRFGKPLPASAFAIAFLPEKYRKDEYRIAGLWEFLNYKEDKIREIPVVIVTEPLTAEANNEELKNLEKHGSVRMESFEKSELSALSKEFLKGKPYYTDSSFFILVDGSRHIRGYYDGRYAAEIKRLIDEYRHLRIKEEKTKITESNEIHRNS